METIKLSLQERILESDTDKLDWNYNVGKSKSTIWTSKKP